MAMLQGYCLNMLQENRALKRAIGIGIDTSSKVTGRQGGSEDFYALEVAAWTPELENRAQELKKDFGLLKPDNATCAAVSVDEFPQAASGAGTATISPTPTSGTRKTRP
jgi:hypothetical protein